MKQTKYNYPVAPSKPVTEYYFGTKITDHYRNFEDLKDSAVQTWFKAQGIYAENILDNIPGRDKLIKKMEELSQRKDFNISNINVTRDNQYFFLKQQKGDETAQVFYRKDENSEDEFLYDPKDYKPETKKNYVISNISPSWDGRYLVIAITHGGLEISEMIILDMTTRKVLPQIITHGRTYIKWFPNSNGFAYMHCPVIDINSTRLWKDMKMVRYYIGNDPKELDVFFSKDTHPQLIASGDFFSIALYSPLDKYILGYISKSTSSKYPETYYTTIEELEHGIPNWKPLLTADDQARYAELINDTCS